MRGKISFKKMYLPHEFANTMLRKVLEQQRGETGLYFVH